MTTNYRIEYQSLNNYKEKQYKISCIISTYNSEEFMAECLDDVENQTVADDVEIVIVDANSPQKEKDIVLEYQKKYTNIKYFRTDTRITVYAAWNLAIRKSVGQYITTQNTNDRLCSDAHQIMARFLDDNPDVMLVYGDSYLTPIPHSTIQDARNAPEIDAWRWPDYRYEFLLQYSTIGPHPMWRKQVHKHIGYFNDNLVALGDQEFWLRMGLYYKLLHIPLFTGLVWEDEQSLSRRPKAFEENSQIRTKYNDIFNQHIEKVKDFYNVIIDYIEQNKITQAIKSRLQKVEIRNLQLAGTGERLIISNGYNRHNVRSPVPARKNLLFCRRLNQGLSKTSFTI